MRTVGTGVEHFRVGSGRGQTETDGPQTETNGPQTETDGPQTETDGPQTETDGPQTETDGPLDRFDLSETDYSGLSFDWLTDKIGSDSTFGDTDTCMSRDAHSDWFSQKTSCSIVTQLSGVHCISLLSSFNGSYCGGGVHTYIGPSRFIF